MPKRDTKLMQTDTVKMKINTYDHTPVKRRPYRTPLKHERQLTKPWMKCLWQILLRDQGQVTHYGWSGGFSPGTPVFAHLR